MATKTFKIGLNSADKTAMAQEVYERLISMCFNEYDPSAIYNTGDFVVYENPTGTFKLYKCNSNNVTGAWDSSKWDLATFQDLVDDIEDAVAFVNDKANVDGNYPTMTVGSADSLTPYGENSGAEDDTPFVFQSSGGSSDVGSKVYLRELRGNSVAFNQLVQNGNFASSSGWNVGNGTLSVANNVGTFTKSASSVNMALYRLNTDFPTFVANNTYLIISYIKASASCNLRWECGNVNSPTTSMTANTKAFVGGIVKPTALGSFSLCLRDMTTLNANETLEISEVQLIDLTLMFGAGNEPTSVLEFNRLFPKAYYEYNAGTLLSCKVNGIKNVGYNALSLDRTEGTLTLGKSEPRAFKENEYYLGFTADNYYYKVQVASFSKTDDSITIQVNGSGYGVGLPVRVIAGQNYTLERTSSNANDTGYYMSWFDANGNYISNSGNYTGLFTAPNNAYWGVIVLRPVINVLTTYTNISFHLTWDGSRTGYEEYKEWQYNLPNIETRSAGSAYDVLYSTGGGKRRIGVVDLGTLNYNYDSANARFISQSAIPGIGGELKETSFFKNDICALYRNSTSTQNKTFFILSPSNQIYIYDSAYNNATTFKTAMSGVMLYYELATETDITTEENPGWTNPQDIDDFGTQEFLYDNDITIPIPQGNDFFYPVDYKAFIDSLGGREDIEYDASKIVSQEQLQASEIERDAVDNILLENISGTLRQLLAVSGSISFDNTLVVNLGNMTNWARYNSGAGYTYTCTPPNMKADTSKILCPKYGITTASQTAMPNKSIRASGWNGVIAIRDDDYTTVDDFKNAMKGVLLAYEKA